MLPQHGCLTSGAEWVLSNKPFVLTELPLLGWEKRAEVLGALETRQGNGGDNLPPSRIYRIVALMGMPGLDLPVV